MNGKRMWMVGVLVIASATVAYAQNGGNGGTSGGLTCCTPGLELTDAEAQSIIFMREEEKLARDVYLNSLELWDSVVFANISQSEQRHMDALAGLITCYDLTDPVVDDTPGVFTNPVFTQLYAELTQASAVSEVEAFKVGALIEELDIQDLVEAMETIENADVQNVYANLTRGSRNHLRSFAALIEAAGETYTAQYLTQEEFDAIADSPKERGTGQCGNGSGNGQGRGNRQRLGQGKQQQAGQGIQQRLGQGGVNRQRLRDGSGAGCRLNRNCPRTNAQSNQ